MARKAREIKPDGTYHTTSRCYNCEKRLSLDLFKAIFLECIRKAQEKYKFKLIQFTIMENHFHLIIQTIVGEASISRIMQHIKAGFSQKYNRMMGCTGPFWNERFSSTLIDKPEHDSEHNINYFYNATMYVGYNPVVKGICADPRDYQFSSFRAYFDKNYNPPVRIDFHDAYLSLGNNFEERRSFLLNYEQRYREHLGLTPLKLF